MEFTARQINERLDELVTLGVFGPNFAFRTKQKETIIMIAYYYLNKITENVILDCPTGGGKSIIAMVTSKLIETFDDKGYILTSDKALQSQYDADFSKMNIRWGNLMGIDNYSCSINDLPFSIGECRIRNMSYKQAETLQCSYTCGYLQNRRRAIMSNVSLLNYSIWLLPFKEYPV